MIVAKNDEAISPDTERHFARRMGSGANTVEIASSHAAMVSYPAEVAELIAKAATVTSRLGIDTPAFALDEHELPPEHACATES